MTLLYTESEAATELRQVACIADAIEGKPS